MANKQIKKPVLPIPSWANDPVLTDPGKPWDATASKVQPGLGKRDAGYLPEENPPAQHLNQQFNELGRWVQYLSNIQVLNWQNSATVNETTANSCHAITYDEGSRTFFVGGGSDTVHASTSLASFSYLGPTGAPLIPVPVWDSAASKPNFAAPIHILANVLFGSSTNQSVVEYLSAGGFTDFLLPAAGLVASSTNVLWDQDSQQWIVAGVDNLTDPAFWYDSTPVAGFTQNIPAAPNSSTVLHVAAAVSHPSGTPFLVAIGDGVLPAADLWISTDGQTWTQNAPVGINAGEAMRAICWDPLNETFLMTTNLNVYTSQLGINWSIVSTSAVPDFQTKCLATNGNGFFVALTDGVPFQMRYSEDGGATWRGVYLPDFDSPSGSPSSLIFSRARNQFLATCIDGAQGSIAFSLSVGDSPFDANNFFDPPVVT